tara:strand:- start:7894 stop:9687 length:1794 start_codon:yes stop_codon:yes gene_type:complete
MAEKKPAINYTSREFATIKNDLVNYARRYYPEKFRDFSANSFGSLMMDTVAYVGDILSFYLDYQVNESFLSTAMEYDNVLKLARQFGYKANLSPSSYGILTFFVLVPSSNGAPDFDYAPILKRGSKLKTNTGKTFTLVEDVNFKDQTANEVVVGEVDTTTGAPLTYAVRARGQAVSGELAVKNVILGDYIRFRQVKVTGNNITEIVSVVDSAGNPYYEVDNLTQNTIYVPLINRGDDSTTVTNILKPISVPRRYTVIKEKGQVLLQFGFGTNEDKEKVLDPSNVMIEQHGKQYITDDSFDPAILLKTDKLGVVPSNTVLNITYRVNSTLDTNASINTIIHVADPSFEFPSETTLNANSVATVRASLEVTNEEAFVGSNPLPSADEIKMRAFGAYSMQNRMVTKDDFIAAAYSMPANFGTIQKVNVLQDADSFNQRNINMYIMSKNSLGQLVKANTTIKTNLKTWLMRLKMLNDTIDILDANVINLQIKFKIAAYANVNKYNALDTAKKDIVSFFNNRVGYEIGEPFKITDIYSVLKNSAAVLDAIDVEVSVKSGGDYADSNFDIEANKSADGRKIFCPQDSIFNVKFPNADIIGTVV